MIQQTLKDKSSTETTVDGKASYLVTAGGNIKCLRCTAKSSRTKQQCCRPALKSSKTQKCGSHGGLSTGPKTAEGRQRIADAQTVHGRDTKAERLERSRGLLRLAQLEDAMHVFGMTAAKRTRGRKPNGYTPLRTIADVCRFLIDTNLHTVRGAVDGHGFFVTKTHSPQPPEAKG
jgi:hypothetical protein